MMPPLNKAVSQEQVETLLSVMPLDGVPYDLDAVKATLSAVFGDRPLPADAINAALGELGGDEARAILIKYLSLARGDELLPWIDNLLKSNKLFECGQAACSLLHLDESRGLNEIERIYGATRGGHIDSSSFSLGWIADSLIEHGTNESLALLAKLRKIP